MLTCLDIINDQGQNIVLLIGCNYLALCKETKNSPKLTGHIRSTNMFFPVSNFVTHRIAQSFKISQAERRVLRKEVQIPPPIPLPVPSRIQATKPPWPRHATRGVLLTSVKSVNCIHLLGSPQSHSGNVLWICCTLVKHSVSQSYLRFLWMKHVYYYIMCLKLSNPSKISVAKIWEIWGPEPQFSHDTYIETITDLLLRGKHVTSPDFIFQLGCQVKLVPTHSILTLNSLALTFSQKDQKSIKRLLSPFKENIANIAIILLGLDK